MWFRLKIETKIICVGITTLILALVGFSLSLYTIIKEEAIHDDQLLHAQLNGTHHLKHVFNIHLDKKVIDVATAIFLIFSALGVGFSILLIIGVKKNIQDFVIAYLGYGILMTIALLISALLELVHGCLPAGIVTIILTVLYTCCLLPIYKGYEIMANGTMLGNNPYAIMENEE